MQSLLLYFGSLLEIDGNVSWLFANTISCNVVVLVNFKVSANKKHSLAKFAFNSVLNLLTTQS